VRIVRWIAAVLSFLGVFLAVFIGGAFLVLRPKADAEYELEVSLGRLKDEYARKKHQAENLDAFRAQMRELERIVSRARSVLPDAFDRDFSAVYDAARRRALRIDEAVLAPEQPREFFSRLPLRIKLTGRYHDLGAFAADVEGAPGSLVLQDLRLYPAATPGRVTMEGYVMAYRYRTDEEIEAERKKAARGVKG